jgi:4-amino-4-deoxy-L-arabinose transferase-like glycosyltransferase
VGQLRQERGGPDGPLAHGVLRRAGLEEGCLIDGARREPSAPVARLLAGVVVLALVALLLGALPRELTKTDEHRYIAVAREMVVSGDWIVCRLNGELYTHKPPGFFQAAALARTLGASWTLAAMLPSVLGGALCVGLVFDLGHRLWGRAAAWGAAAALLTAKEHYLLSCRGNLDAYLSVWTTLSAWCFVRGCVLPATPRARTLWTAGAYLASGVGVMVKGPSALVIPGAAALVTLLWDASWERTPWWRWVLGCVALVAAPAPATLWPPIAYTLLAARIAAFLLLTGVVRSRWSALATRGWLLAPLAIVPGLAWAVVAAGRAPEGWGYVRDLAFGHGVLHAAGQVDKLEPWWHYAVSFPQDVLPWTLLLPAAFFVWLRPAAQGRSAADRFAMAWLVAPVVAMSLSAAKRDLYLLPVVPAVALLVGRLVAALSSGPALWSEPWVSRPRRVYAAVGVLCGMALATFGAADLLGAERRVTALWRALEANEGMLTGAVSWAATATGIVLVAASAGVGRARSFPSAARAGLVGLAAATAATAWIYIPFTESRFAERPFLEQVRDRIGDGSLRAADGACFAANWVCERSVVPVLKTEDDVALALATQTGRSYIVLEASRLARTELPGDIRVLLEDPRRGRERLVLIGRE